MIGDIIMNVSEKIRYYRELKEQGYTTICGRIPKAYYEKKIYGMTKE